MTGAIAARVSKHPSLTIRLFNSLTIVELSSS